MVIVVEIVSTVLVVVLVVVLVAVDVMNDLATPQRPTKHFFGYYSVLMPLMEFFVGARFCMGRNS